MARLSRRREAEERHKLATGIAAGLCVVAVLMLSLQVALDRWQQNRVAKGPEVAEAGAVSVSDCTLTLNSPLPTGDPSDKFLGQRIRVRGHLRRYMPGAVELVPGETSDLSRPALLVEAYLTESGWGELQSAVRERDAKLFQLRESDLASARVGSAMMLRGTLISNAEGTWVLAECNHCTYQPGSYDSITVDSTPMPEPDQDPFGIGRLMAQKHLRIDGEPVSSTTDIEQAMAAIAEQVAATRPPSVQNFDGDDPVVLSVPAGDTTYNVTLSQWKAAQHQAAGMPGKTALDCIAAHVLYRRLVDAGVYPSYASYAVRINSGFVVMPTPAEMMMEVDARRDVAMAQIGLMSGY